MAGKWLNVLLLIMAGGTLAVACLPASAGRDIAKGSSDTQQGATKETDTSGFNISPDRFQQLLGRDDIRPIYSPKFVSVKEATYHDDELVLGVEINGQSKAYPIGPLNFREMVNDELGGTPILITW